MMDKQTDDDVDWRYQEGLHDDDRDSIDKNKSKAKLRGVNAVNVKMKNTRSKDKN